MGAKPHDSITAASAGLSNWESPDESAFKSVFLRWANAARTTLKNMVSLLISQTGSFRMVSFKTALVTFGCGMKQLAGTSNSSSGSA